MATQGGPARPVSVQTGGQRIGGPAIPIAVVTDGRAVEGGPAMPIMVVTSGPVQGGPALPVVVATGAQASQVAAGTAIPAYVVSGSLGGSPPVNTVLPVISGTAETGQALSTTNGTWTNAPTSYSYQWQRNGSDIGGATSSTYTTVAADSGTTITVVVTATNGAGAASATSAGIAIFAPTTLSGLAFWVQGDTVSGNDGDLIATWPDGSGNGRDATASGALRATLKKNILNSHAVLRFAGAQGYLTPSIDFTGTQGSTVFAVASCVSGSDRVVVELTTSTAANVTGFLLYRQNTANHPVAFCRGNIGNSTYTHNVSMVSTSDFRLLAGKYDKALATNEAIAWVNGGWDGTVVSVNNTNAFANAPLYVGARAQSSLFWSGDIAEIVVYNRALNATERLQLQGYFNTKYNLYFAVDATTIIDSADSTTITDPYVGDIVLHHSSHARQVFTTSATSIEIATYNDLYPSYPAFTQIGVKSNGATVATLAPGANGEKLLTNSLPVGANKTIEVIAGLQSRPAASVLGTFLKSITFPAATATRATVSITPRLFVYGNSIASGGNATSTPIDAWDSLLRADYTDILIDAYGFRTLWDNANTALLRAALVARIAATAPTLIWLAIGTNDYALNKWSAAAFGAAYAALLDDLHAALPSATIYCQTPILRVAPASEAPNGSGSTLGDYRTQIATAQSTRGPWAALVDGTAIVAAGPDYDADGIHLTTTGHATYYASVKTTLGL